MDWSRAKNILIIVMVLLNIFLLFAIGLYITGRNISRETVASTVQILESRDVIVKCSMPGFNRNTPSLICGNSGFDRKKAAAKLLGEGYISSGGAYTEEKLINGDRELVFYNESYFEFTNGKPSDRVKIKDQKSAERYVRKVIGGLGIDPSSYILDRDTINPDGSRTLIFIEKYKKFLVFDNRIESTLTEKGITYLKGNYRKIMGFTKRSMPIMPAHQILLKNYGENSNVIITDINIGFKGFIGDELNLQEFSEGPAWRITTMDGNMRYFKASDGEEIN